MDVHEQCAMGLDSRAVSDLVTKQIVTIFSKTCNKDDYCIETVPHAINSHVLTSQFTCYYKPALLL